MKYLSTSALASFLFAASAASAQSQPAKSEPSLSVTASPNQWKVNASGTLSIAFKVRDGEIGPGGKIALTLPSAWNAHIFHPAERDGLMFPYQTYSQMTKDVTDRIAIDSPPGARLVLDLQEMGSDGLYHRIARTAVLTVESGTLKAGDVVTLRYGTIEKHIHASFIAERVNLVAQISSNGRDWRDISESARLITEAGPAVSLQIASPSTGWLGHEQWFDVSARDRFGNAAALPADTVLTIDGATPPKCTPREGEHLRCTTLFDGTGFRWARAAAAGLPPVVSDPVKVTSTEPEMKLYWGDIHSHSEISVDGMGGNAFDFARDISLLDFYASTEHAGDNQQLRGKGISDNEWSLIKKRVRDYYKPGRFVTLLGYEMSFLNPSGHHNVYFRDDTGPLIQLDQADDVRELWKQLGRTEALTIPHHTGITFAPGMLGDSAEFDENFHNDERRPVLEVFSSHGSSEYYNPFDEFSFENQIPTQRWKNWVPRLASSTTLAQRQWASAESVPGKHYLRDALALGNSMGVNASSDDHTAQPGQAYKGLTAIYAPSLTREAIYDGLKARRSYATTGRRIHLDFRIGDSDQGVSSSASRSPIRFEVAASAPLAKVELMAMDKESGKFLSVKTWSSTERTLEGSFDDAAFCDRTLYYIRVEVDERIADRAVRAWSSPIRTSCP